MVHLRNEFEKNKNLKDPGEIIQLMKATEEYIDVEDLSLIYDIYPWDGPSGIAFGRFPNYPKKRFEYQLGTYTFDANWIDETTDEYYAKLDIEKFKARYLTLFRDITLSIKDYPRWLYLKKRLEEELKFCIEHVQSQMNTSMFDWFMDYPYNKINQFSDGYKADYSLNLSFHDHWDEDLWKHVANLDTQEQEHLTHSALLNHDSHYSNESRRSHGRYLSH